VLQRLRTLRTLFATTGAIFSITWQAYPAGLLLTLALQILQGLFPLGTALLTKFLFDALAQSIAMHGALALSGRVILLLILQMLLTVGSQLVTPLDQYISGEIGRRLALFIQRNVYHKVTGFMGLAYFEDQELYNTIMLAVNGARTSPLQILRALTTIIRGVATTASFLGVMLSFNLFLAGIVFLTVIPQFLLQIRLGKQRFNVTLGNSPRDRLALYYSQVMSGAAFAKEMRLFNLGDYFLGAFTKIIRIIQAVQRHQQRRELFWQAVCMALSTVVGGGAFIFVFVQAFQGHLSFGDVSLYTSAVATIQGTLMSIVFTSAQISEQMLYFRQYTNLLAMPQPLPIATNPREVPVLSQGIELRDVSFRYSEKHPWVLRHVNLYIPAGQCLALVGLNGAGKTTLVKLLARLYDPSEGQVLWDGIDLREFDPLALRKHIAAIFQDFARYDLTAQENIGLGDAERIQEMEAIREAARQAGIDEYIDGLPQGYETVLSRWLGEKKAGPGVDLSGGQWQKIALARMFMRQADVLMLDEPTAALDAQSEHELHQRFASLMDGHTSLLITHRFSTVRMADAIAVLEDGQIIEYGTHKDLLASHGTYARLYRMQAEHYQPIST
jgi:ATP-binding cassette subfamily B protein